MSLDPTARESNIRDSIKKYFVDNLYSTEGIDLTFDKSLSTPPVTQGISVNRWVSVKFGQMSFDSFSEVYLDIACCTRQDAEGYRLAQLRDTVMGYLTDTSPSDGMRRIPFYRSRATGAWTLLGALLVQNVSESMQMELEDETKYKVLTVRLRFASKV
jgi:hypothetical protein